MLVMPFLGYSVLMLVPHWTVKLELQEECCIFIARTHLMMEHEERELPLELEKEMWQVTRLLSCNNRPTLFSIVKSWFSPTTHSLPCNTHINTVFKDTVNIITESLWIWKIHLNRDVNSSCPFLWNNCRIGLCLMLWEYGRVSDD